MYYIYVLRCKGGSLYAGITSELSRRMRQHCGICPGGAKYTRSHPPEAVVCIWQADSHSAALQLEAAFKKLTRGKKQLLVGAPEQWQDYFPQLELQRYMPISAMPLTEYLKGSESAAKVLDKRKKL